MVPVLPQDDPAGGDEQLMRQHPAYCRCAATSCLAAAGGRGEGWAGWGRQLFCTIPSSTLLDSVSHFQPNPRALRPLHAVRCSPHCRRPNIWPVQQLPELEPAFKALGGLICAVGLLLAAHCDKYVAAQGMRLAQPLRGILADSPCPKVRARLLARLGGGRSKRMWR